MSVKRYEWVACDEHSCHCDVVESAEGDMVNYEDYAALEARCAALAAESSGMSAFVDALLSIAWQGGSADGADIQDLALKNGLLRQEVYSADEHENQVDDPGNFEEGDPVYFRVDTQTTDAFLAEVRAQGVDSAVETITVHMNPRHLAVAEVLHMLRTHADQLRKGVQS